MHLASNFFYWNAGSAQTKSDPVGDGDWENCQDWKPYRSEETCSRSGEFPDKSDASDESVNKLSEVQLDVWRIPEEKSQSWANYQSTERKYRGSKNKKLNYHKKLLRY